MKINGQPVIDAKQNLKLPITAGDIKLGHPKSPSSCAAARAVLRSVPKCAAARIHLGRSYINMGKYWLRYMTGQALRSEIVAVDRGGAFLPGLYTLARITPSKLNTGKRKGTTGRLRRQKRKPPRNGPITSFPACASTGPPSNHRSHPPKGRRMTAYTNGNSIVPALDAKSTAQQFLEEHEIMKRQLELMTAENVELRLESANLLNEVNLLRDELNRADSAVFRLQGFAAGLVTRMTVVSETIAVAVKEAAEHNIEREPKPAPERTKPEKIDGHEVGQKIFSALPRNEL